MEVYACKHKNNTISIHISVKYIFAAFNYNITHTPCTLSVYASGCACVCVLGR